MARRRDSGFVLDGVRAVLLAATRPLLTREIAAVVGHESSISTTLSDLVRWGEAVRSGGYPMRYAHASRRELLDALPVSRHVPRPTVMPPVRGRLYGGCPCGCTPRVIGYHTDPARSWLSGPVLGCGRGEAAA